MRIRKLCRKTRQSEAMRLAKIEKARAMTAQNADSTFALDARPDLDPAVTPATRSARAEAAFLTDQILTAVEGWIRTVGPKRPVSVWTTVNDRGADLPVGLRVRKDHGTWHLEAAVDPRHNRQDEKPGPQAVWTQLTECPRKVREIAATMVLDLKALAADPCVATG